MHLKPFLACSFKVACFFSFFVAFHFLDFFILKEKNNFEENLNLGYDNDKSPLLLLYLLYHHFHM
jgi:hypothetical protein